MEKSSKILTQLIQVFDTSFCLRIKFESEGESKPSGSGLHACFLLDRSGSMAGQPIKDAKGALISFITKMEKLTVPVTIIAFNDKFEEATSSKLGYEGLRAWAEKIQGGGGTLFKNVFDAMQKKFIKDHLDNTFVMIMSDGQDNEGLPKLMPYLESFKNTIIKNSFTSSIHTIGFSADHDAKLLTTITTFGTKAGTFQFLERDGRIPVAVNNATEFLYQTSMWGQYIGPNKVPIKLEISDDEKDPKIHYGIVFVNETDIGEAKIELYYQGKKMEYAADLQKTELTDLEEKVQIFTSYVSSTVLSVLDKRSQKLLSKDEQPGLVAQMTKIDKMLDDLMASIRKQRSLQRKQMMPFCMQAKDLVTEFFSVLKEDVTSELSNVKLAQLNRLAYQNILSRSLMKKINKRVGENAGMLQEIDQEINKIITGYNFKEMGEKYKDAIEVYGHCLISYRDWFDALQDGDCFCLTFDAQRAEGGIMDPSLVTIKTINTTQLTAESFLDSALFITRAGQIIKGVGEHGTVASSLVKGLPDEVITGIFPLYINEEHWRVAKLRMKPLLAWTIAQDVLAFETKQLTVLPFVLLAKAAITQTTEHKKTQYKLILDTCAAIYRDNKGFILPDIKSRFEAYIAKPEVRTIDSISNNRVFLLQLLVASMAGDIDAKAIPSILPYVMEEEIRRNSAKLDIGIHEFYMKILEVDTARYVDPYIKSFTEELHSEKMADSENHGEHIKQLLKDKHIELEEVKKGGIALGEESKSKAPAASAAKEESKIEVDTSKIGTRGEKTVERINEHFKKPDWNVAQTNAILNVFGIKPYGCIEDMGIDSAAKKLIFAIQTITQKANSDRREAIEKGKYVNPFDEAQACLAVKSLYIEHVELERNNQKSKILAENIKQNVNASAPLFASTKDVYDAAGILMGTLRGSEKFNHYHKALRVAGCPLVIEKVKMLVSGQFMGIKLIVDEVTNPKELSNGFLTWKAKKKHAFKIWKPNCTFAPITEWQQAFPHLAEYLDGQEKRRNGIFVPYRHPKKNVNDQRHRANMKKPAPAPGKGKGKKKKTK